jgi:hypothetical protein
MTSEDQLGLFIIVMNLAVLGQFLDIWTTAVALAHGLQEGNPIAAKIMAKIGTLGFGLIKVLALPAVCVLLAITQGWTLGIIVASIVAGTGFLAGIPNYRLLKSKGIRLL